MRSETPLEFPDPDRGASDFDVAATPVRAKPTSIVSRYPHRTIKPVTEEVDPRDGVSPMRNLVVPIVLLSVGLGLRIAQLLYANEGHGNRWAGNVGTPTGLGKALALVSFEMIIASAIMGLGAVIAAMMLGVEFGPIGRAALKLCSAAVFSVGVASWVALFDQDRYSIGGLALALHVMVVLNWISLGYFFRMELQELLLTVAIVTALHAVAMAALWRS